MAERSRKPKYDFKILIRSTFFDGAVTLDECWLRVRKARLVNDFSYFRHRR
jgi:hypothetical protein